MATVCSLFPVLLLLQWKYHGHCQALKFIYVVGVGFVVSTAIIALYSFTDIFGQLVFSCPRKINKKPNMHLMLLKLWRFKKPSEPFFSVAVLILRPHSLEIRISLVWVVGSSCVSLNCSARSVLFHCLKILKSPTLISVAVVKLVRCCIQVANLQHYPLSFLP